MTALIARQRERLRLGGAIAIALAFFGVFYLVALKPFMATVSALGQEVQTTNVKLQYIQQGIAQEPKIREELKELTASLHTLRASMPSEKQLPSVIERLSDMANESGVKIQTIFPQRESEKSSSTSSEPSHASPSAEDEAKLYKEIPIQIEALAGFHQLGNFLYRMEGGSQPIQLRSLRMTTNTKDMHLHTIKMVLGAFFRTTESMKTPDDINAMLGGSS